MKFILVLIQLEYFFLFFHLVHYEMVTICTNDRIYSCFICVFDILDVSAGRIRFNLCTSFNQYVIKQYKSNCNDNWDFNDKNATIAWIFIFEKKNNIFFCSNFWMPNKTSNKKPASIKVEIKNIIDVVSLALYKEERKKNNNNKYSLILLLAFELSKSIQLKWTEKCVVALIYVDSSQSHTNTVWTTFRNEIHCR